MFSIFSKPEKIFSSMSITEILKRTLYLYRENFALLAGIAFPGWILILFSGSMLGKVTLVNIPQVSSDEIPVVDIIKTGLVSVLAMNMIFFILLFMTAAGTIAISKRILGEKIKAGQSYKNVLNRIFPLIGSLVLASFVMGFGFVLPMIGILVGSFFYVRYNLVPQVVMLEAEGGIGAMKRAKGLISEYFKKAAILLAPPLILQTIIMVSIYRVIQIIPYSSLALLVIALMTITVGTLTEPFKILISTLLYYELRITKEGYDLEIMEKELKGDSIDD